VRSLFRYAALILAWSSFNSSDSTQIFSISLLFLSSPIFYLDISAARACSIALKSIFGSFPWKIYLLIGSKAVDLKAILQLSVIENKIKIIRQDDPFIILNQIDTLQL